LTYAGGSYNQGTVFELSPPPNPGGSWTEAVLYSFQRSTDGGNPLAGLVFDEIGNLYGTTSRGGNVYCTCGVVFRLSPPPQPGGQWSETVLHTFGSGDDNAGYPSGLTRAKTGAMLGTGSFGNAGCGVVFGLAPHAGGIWVYELLYNFQCYPNDGRAPESRLTLGRGNIFYGSTLAGGSADQGTVFRIAYNPGSGWTETVLYSFSQGPDGFEPSAPVLVSNNALYGTTSLGGYDNCQSGLGCGTLFQLVPCAHLLSVNSVRC